MKKRKKDKQALQNKAKGLPRCKGCGNAFPPDKLEEGHDPMDVGKPALVCSKCAYDQMMDS